MVGYNNLDWISHIYFWLWAICWWIWVMLSRSLASTTEALLSRYACSVSPWKWRPVRHMSAHSQQTWYKRGGSWFFLPWTGAAPVNLQSQDLRWSGLSRTACSMHFSRANARPAVLVESVPDASAIAWPETDLNLEVAILGCAIFGQ